MERSLLSEDIDGAEPWIDPLVPINANRIEQVAQRLALSDDEVRAHYRALSDFYQLLIED